MFYFLIGLILLAAVVFGGRGFVQANPADLARKLRTLGGIALLLVGGVFLVTGRFMFAIPTIGFGLSLLGLAGLGGLTGTYKPNKSSGQRSRVRTAMIEMELEHDTGEMSGVVLAGSFQGRGLDDLDEEQLRAVWQECLQDGQGLILIEAYLVRRFAGWREHFQSDGTEGQGGPASSGPMTDEEAYEILGLSSDAGDAEVRAAHRRLMLRVHPDKGGSDFLAAKINEAKDTLLRRH